MKALSPFESIKKTVIVLTEDIVIFEM